MSNSVKSCRTSCTKNSHYCCQLSQQNLCSLYSPGSNLAQHIVFSNHVSLVSFILEQAPQSFLLTYVPNSFKGYRPFIPGQVPQSGSIQVFRFRTCFLGRNYIKMMLGFFSIGEHTMSVPGTTVNLILITWSRRCLPAFSMVKAPFLPL